MPCSAIAICAPSPKVCTARPAFEACAVDPVTSSILPGRATLVTPAATDSPTSSPADPSLPDWSPDDAPHWYVWR